MPKVYGSMLCSDCVEAKEYFEKVNYKYEFVNITESMKNLKEFLEISELRMEILDKKSNRMSRANAGVSECNKFPDLQRILDFFIVKKFTQ